MSSQLVLEAARHYAVSRKELLVDDATHLLLVSRGGALCAALSSSELNPLLAGGAIAGAAYGADSLALVLEAIRPLTPHNPITGQPWERGEAEQLWRDQHAFSTGVVSEVQVFVVAGRDGSAAHSVTPFDVVDGSITWADPLEQGRSPGLDDVLATFLSAPPVDPARVPSGENLSPDPGNGQFHDAAYGRVSLDIGATRILGRQLEGQGEALLLVGSESRAQYLIGEGLPSWQVEVWSE